MHGNNTSSWSAVQRERGGRKSRAALLFTSKEMRPFNFLLNTQKAAQERESELFNTGGVCAFSFNEPTLDNPDSGHLFLHLLVNDFFLLFLYLVLGVVVSCFFYPAICYLFVFVLFALGAFTGFTLNMGGLSDNLSAAFSRCYHAHILSEMVRREWAR